MESETLVMLVENKGDLPRSQEMLEAEKKVFEEQEGLPYMCTR